MNIRNPKFNIEDRVYHCTPESEVGIIKDIRYIFSIDWYQYYVVNSWDKGDWVSENELVTDKIII